MNNQPTDLLKFLPVKPEEIKRKKIKKLHDNLPQPFGLFCIIIGQVKTGKSCVVQNLFMNDSYYNDVFRDIHVCSNTISCCSTSRFMYKKHKNTCYEMYEDKLIDNFITSQKLRMENPKEDTSFAWIFDDCLGDLGSGRGSNKTGGNRINFFATKFRHYANKGSPTCMIFTTQKYLALNSIIRNQANCIMISGRIAANRELAAIESDYAGVLGGNDNFRTLMNYVRKIPYAFLTIRLDRGDGIEAWLNFEKCLWKSNGDSDYSEEEI